MLVTQNGDVTGGGAFPVISMVKVRISKRGAIFEEVVNVKRAAGSSKPVSKVLTLVGVMEHKTLPAGMEAIIVL